MTFIESVKTGVTEHGLDKVGSEAVLAHRREGLAAFESTGLPHRRLEDWRYTDVSRLQKRAFTHHAAPATPSDDAVEAYRFDDAEWELVLVDGRVSPGLSRLPSSGSLEVVSLADAVRDGNDILDKLGTASPASLGGFASLNSALALDGAAIRVKANAGIEDVLHVLHYSSANADAASHPRNLIVLEENAALTLVETWAGGGESSDGQLHNSVTEVLLDKDAELEHHIWQREGNDTTHVGRIAVKQAAGSHYRAVSLWLGGALSRNDLHVTFEGENAKCELEGLFAGGGEQHIDNHTVIDHTVGHCTSRQLYKGVLGGKAHGVFNGKVIFREDAQKSDTEQANHNLLLSRTADIDTKPELEIFADDVKASHGSTVGQLDEEQIFYMRSRGLSVDAAQHMLTAAFAAEVTSGIENEEIRKRAQSLAEAKLDTLLDASSNGGQA